MKNSNNPPIDDDFKELNTEIERLIAEEERIRKLRQEKQVQQRKKIYKKIMDKPLALESSDGIKLGEATEKEE